MKQLVRERRQAISRVALGVFVMMSRSCSMPGKSFVGALAPLTAEQGSTAAELKAHVVFLAGEIGHRDVEHPENLERAAKYIEAQFGAAKLTPARQVYKAGGRDVANIDATLAGRSEEIVVIGAHYDSVRGSPGANDNASGVAAMLVLAKRLGATPHKRTLRFVAFVNEEPPFFQTPEMGSLVYAKACREKKEAIVAMLSLETIGFYSDEPRSQHYPAPFSAFYPSTGNFIAFVGNLGSADLVKRIVKRFRSDVDFPSEGAAMLGSIEGVGWSDHWSFWKAGYPGVMVTDTAPFRYKAYHTMDDTPDKLDYERTARVVNGLEKVVRYLADE